MKLVYDAPAGCRVKKGFWGIQTGYSDLWWCKTSKKWLPYSKVVGEASNTCPCNSERAFLSHLRRHPELENVVVWLIHREYTEDYHFNITAVPKEADQ